MSSIRSSSSEGITMLFRGDTEIARVYKKGDKDVLEVPSCMGDAVFDMALGFFSFQRKFGIPEKSEQLSSRTENE